MGEAVKNRQNCLDKSGHSGAVNNRTGTSDFL